ncbi:hypothetical protein [Streptomyces beijiangensis]|uniref:Uncharacterized protein n=1 Tax=Streptomyces beijiangensis TaxID=163361 RepID=A0A939FBP3_9ACTN|nr:hypothetical protein [Streptomyces beijiangensis]MBO0515123.1 hypothetical protein [Streptomyces beijiangensis]
MEMSGVVPQSPSAVSMRDLLASCAAAAAVSTPPQEEEQEQDRDQENAEERRDAA